MTSLPPLVCPPVQLPKGRHFGGARHLLPVRPAFFRIRRAKTPARVARLQAAATSGVAGPMRPAAIGGPRHG